MRQDQSCEEYITVSEDVVEALIVVDAQNEFSDRGQRPVPNHDLILGRILRRVARARENGDCIAWVQHHNRPNESPAFVPGSWGAELSPGLGPNKDSNNERLFQKDVYGAFTGTDLESWLRSKQVEKVVLVGFFSHMCVSTSTREALVRGFSVAVDALGTGARELVHPMLGRQSADEVRRSALLQLSDMGAEILGIGQEEIDAQVVSVSR